jgi:hypothetical protein
VGGGNPSQKNAINQILEVNVMAKVEKWFVAEYIRKDCFHKDGFIIFSEGFRTREMAEIECRMLRQNPENEGKHLMTIRREVKAEPIPRKYEAYGENNYAERKIFEAIAEYQRCNEW